jgi:DNA-binding transcriptional LysR family regulator
MQKRQERNHDLQVGPLRTLVAIVDLGGFGRAAEALHITQPAVSQQIRRLESLLRQPVFISTGRRMRLSPAGQELLSYARKMIDLNDEVVARFAPVSDSPRIALGIADQFSCMLPEVLRILKRQATGAQVTIQTGVSEVLSEQMSCGSLDLALLINMTGAVPGCRTQQIGRIGTAWFGRPAMAGDAPLPLVVFTEPSTLRDRTLRAFKDCGTPWRIGYEGAELIGLCAAIQAGLGIGCLIANAGELWDLPSAVSAGLPPPPSALPLTLVVSKSTRADLAETVAGAVLQAARLYPVEATSSREAPSP